MEKKTRKKSQLTKGFDKLNIIIPVVVIAIVLFIIGYDVISSMIYKHKISNKLLENNKIVIEDVQQENSK